jgi:hypothetical protein
VKDARGTKEIVMPSGKGAASIVKGAMEFIMKVPGYQN